MVIDDLDVPRLSATPHEAHPPLLVDADAVLSRPIPLQGFKAIARRQAKIVQPLRRVERLELGSRPSLDLKGQPPDRMTGE